MATVLLHPDILEFDGTNLSLNSESASFHIVINEFLIVRESKHSLWSYKPIFANRILNILTRSDTSSIIDLVI